MLPREVRATIWRKLRWLSSADALRTHMEHKIWPRAMSNFNNAYNVSLPINDKRRLLLIHFRYWNVLGITTRTDCECVKVYLRTLEWHVSVRLEHWTQDAIVYCNKD